MPGSPLDIVGLARYEMFVRNAWTRSEPIPTSWRRATYKTAANQYTETTMTAAIARWPSRSTGISTSS